MRRHSIFIYYIKIFLLSNQLLSYSKHIFTVFYFVYYRQVNRSDTWKIKLYMKSYKKKRISLTGNIESTSGHRNVEIYLSLFYESKGFWQHMVSH